MSRLWVLRAVLRVLGWTMVAATIGMAMPWSWMAAGHKAIGLGELPPAPIVDYLIRSASALYVMHGLLCLFAARDLARRCDLAELLGWLWLAFGVAVTIFEVLAGLPWWWVVGEAIGTIGGGLAIIVLARGVQAQDSGAGGR